MLINDLIKTLADISSKHGNIPVVLSSDSEGNSFGTLNEKGSIMIVENFPISNQVIGVCLSPWHEGIDTCEEACKLEK